MAIFSSFEMAPVASDPKSKTAVVAYIQADCSSKDTKFEDTGEGKWAEKAIWPRFRSLITKLNAESTLMVVGGGPSALEHGLVGKLVKALASELWAAVPSVDVARVTALLSTE